MEIHPVHVVSALLAAWMLLTPNSALPSPPEVGAKSTSPANPAPGVLGPRRAWLNPENGQPFFPRGWFEWGQPSLEEAKASADVMAQEGANMVISVASWADTTNDTIAQTNREQTKAYLDHAQRRGLKILFQVSWADDFERRDQAAIARAKAWVEAVRGHPALLGYQTYDEPEGGPPKEAAAKTATSWVQSFVRMHAAIRQWDPNPHHLVQMVFNVVPQEGISAMDWRLFLPALDSFQIDRYGINRQFPYFSNGNNVGGIWGPLRSAWQIAHGVSAIEQTSHRNPATVLQGIGSNFNQGGYAWREPLYEETRYMAYASLTAGGWGVLHWIHNVSSPPIRQNVARLHRELGQLSPALESSWEKPPFAVEHPHAGITRDWLKDKVPDISTLTLEDGKHYYLIAVDNTAVFENVSFRMKLPNIPDVNPRLATVLNEGWSREVKYAAETGQWVIPDHTMCFGDVNIWVIPK
jgi:hypothetical protein